VQDVQDTLLNKKYFKRIIRLMQSRDLDMQILAAELIVPLCRKTTGMWAHRGRAILFAICSIPDLSLFHMHAHAVQNIVDMGVMNPNCLPFMAQSPFEDVALAAESAIRYETVLPSKQLLRVPRVVSVGMNSVNARPVLSTVVHCTELSPS